MASQQTFRGMAVASAVAALSSASFGATVTWSGATADWNTGSNWSTATVPTMADVATFTSTGITKTVTISSGPAFGVASGTYTTVGRMNITTTGYTIGTTSGPILNLTGPTAATPFQLTGAATGPLTVNAPIVFGNIATPVNQNYQIYNTSTNATAIVTFNGPLTAVGAADGDVNQLDFTASAGGTGAFIINGVIQDEPAAYGHTSKVQLRKSTGTGTVLLTAVNTYSGGTNLATGTLQLSGSGTLGATSSTVTMASSTTLDLNGTSQTIGLLNSAGSGGTVINSATATASTLTLGNGVIAGLSGSYLGIIADNAGTGGTQSVVKTGSGIQFLRGVNTYTGTTTVNGGSLLIVGSIGAGATRVGTASAGTGTLGGTGTVGGAVSVDTGGTVAPGSGSNITGGTPTVGNIGTLTINNTLGLFAADNFGTLSFDLDKAVAVLTSDKIAGLTAAPNVTGGTLVLNVTGTLAAGDTFNLIDWASEGVANPIVGTFATINEPALSVGLVWDNSQLYSNGIVAVAAVPEPATLAVLGFGGLSLLARRRK